MGSAEADCLELSGQTRARLQISRVLNTGGISIAYGFRSLSPLDASRDQQGLTVSYWRRTHGVNTSIDLRALNRAASFDRYVWHAPLALYIDSASVPAPQRQTITTSVPLRTMDLRTRFQFHAGPVLLDITGGGTIGQRSQILPWMQDTLLPAPARSSSAQLWGRTEALVPISRWLRLRAGIAALPTQPGVSSPVRAVYSLSAQVVRWRRGRSDGDAAPRDSSAHHAAAFEAILEDASHVRLRLRHFDATSVRVSGEPTHWTPVSLVRTRDGWWETTLAVGPGTYRLNISIDDAAWQPPPGLPTARDEFGGRVGLVTVQ
jgi:hypothetical protein